MQHLLFLKLIRYPHIHFVGLGVDIAFEIFVLAVVVGYVGFPVVGEGVAYAQFVLGDVVAGTELGRPMAPT